MRIVELQIDELDDFTGFEQVALVHSPAIEANFIAFNDEEVIDALAFQVIAQAVKDLFVERIPGESKEDYMERCIPALRAEGMSPEQSVAVCYQSFDLDVSDLPNYVDSPSGSIETKFESYTDYPESATNAAKRALEWRDAHPEQNCLTRVGWARANQLAKREPISEETISRMSSFARHLQYEDVPYSEGCGGLAVDAWGGRAGIEWAQTKLQEIKEEKERLSQPEKYIDDLSITIQEKLLETLGEKGIQLDTLLKKGWKVISEDDFKKEQFGLPTLADSNPDKYTNEGSQKLKVLFQYRGPRDEKNRDFCARMMKYTDERNLLWRKEDIDKLSILGKNSEFGTYNIFDYKGSYGCRHRWTKVYLKRETVTPVVDTKLHRHGFSLDEEQKTIAGPLMLPRKSILRVDDNGDPYYVYFTENTIKQIANKMMRNKLLDKINIEHDQDRSVNGYFMESWIVSDREKDKQQVWGMNYPEGSWLATIKIEDPEVWNMIKRGELRGLSIEGAFIDRLIQLKAI